LSTFVSISITWTAVFPTAIAMRVSITIFEPLSFGHVDGTAPNWLSCQSRQGRDESIIEKVQLAPQQQKVLSA
jgi:hypothetical protein